MYIFLYGSVRLTCLSFSRKLLVVRKITLATTRLPIDVQDMHSRVEQGGFGFYQCCSEFVFFVMVSTIETIMTVGGSFRTLVAPGMYLWPRLGTHSTQWYCIFGCSSAICSEADSLQAAEAHKSVHKGECWARLWSQWHHARHLLWDHMVPELTKGFLFVIVFCRF